LEMRNLGAIVGLCSIILLATLVALGQAAQEATIQPGTAVELVLKDHLSSKLNEVGDTFAAELKEPAYADGQLVLPRGAEFLGRVTQVKPAGRMEQSSQMTIVFDRVVVPWGEEPVSLLLTAIDDWSKDQKLKADDEGKVKGGHNGDATLHNVERGGRLGSLGAASVILLGRGAGAGPGVLGAGGGAIAGGMLGGVLMTKGDDVRLSPGTMFRVRFVKPLTLPVVRQEGRPQTNSRADDSSAGPETKSKYRPVSLVSTTYTTLPAAATPAEQSLQSAATW
jgi:hypothetical protein